MVPQDTPRQTEGERMKNKRTSQVGLSGLPERNMDRVARSERGERE